LLPRTATAATGGGEGGPAKDHQTYTWFTTSTPDWNSLASEHPPKDVVAMPSHVLDDIDELLEEMG
jgi:hypothetical protein